VKGARTRPPCRSPTPVEADAVIFPLLSFGLYLVGAQALSRLDVEREPQQLHPHHVQGHNALCKDPQDGVVGVDTVENCTRKK